ncbi:MAG: signal peptidase I [Deltaproteobacteria bacterium RIFCSPLOWO2_02_FULL_53_8]|nr:MAG: signal peptidase I [Deltaproteobacteria bacterium RIFCSPLOWO2_02_FULL_53_8]
MSLKNIWPFSICFKGCEAADAGVKKKKNSVRELIEAVVIALLLALFIRTFIIQAFKIPSSSMEDTLLIGDHLIVSKFAYGLQMPKPAMIRVFGVRVPFFDTTLVNTWGSIKRGDVIVFRFPGDRDLDFIKRVVGLPGDTVEVKDKVIYINGQKWDESFGIYKGREDGRPAPESMSFGPVTVPPEHVFAMGDNRDRSRDSRDWGFAPMRDIKGKAVILYWSWDSDAHWVRFGRLGNLIR